MALSAERILARRGNELTRNEFAYPVHAGVKVYRGGMVAVNSSGEIILPPASGGIAILGIADRTVDNSGGSGPSTALVTPQRGTFPLPVGSATAANIGAAVYASDDATLTLTAGTLTKAGTLAGIENSVVFVSIVDPA